MYIHEKHDCHVITKMRRTTHANKHRHKDPEHKVGGLVVYLNNEDL